MDEAWEQATKIAILEERISAANKALEKQAVEYERRLDKLNNAHERAQIDRHEFLTKATYETALKEWNLWRDNVSTRLDIMLGRDATKAATVAIALSVIGTLLGLLSIFLRLSR